MRRFAIVLSIISYIGLAPLTGVAALHHRAGCGPSTGPAAPIGERSLRQVAPAVLLPSSWPRVDSLHIARLLWRSASEVRKVTSQHKCCAGCAIAIRYIIGPWCTAAVAR